VQAWPGQEPESRRAARSASMTVVQSADRFTALSYGP
jgi:hypothetical protein